MEDKEHQFASLVSNALDFLAKSIRELEAGEAKYSVINFYSGLELLLKARLLREHWSLSASDVNKITRTRFEDGDFVSIRLEETKNRLANIVGGKLSPSEERIYEKLQKRRNRAVHFFHPDDLSANKKVAVEQLAGWHFLYPRLIDTWRETFEPFQEQLMVLNRCFLARKEYFPSVFAELREEIQKQAQSRLIATCFICEQRAALTSGEVVKGVHRMACSVCNADTFVVFLPCHQCGRPAPRDFEMKIACQWCGHLHRMDVEESFDWAKKTFPATPSAWCGECGYTGRESVIEMERSSLCIACLAFSEFSDIARCGWCGSTVTGSVGDGHSPGCVRCEYHFNYEETGAKAPEFQFPLEYRELNRRLRQKGS